MTKSNIRIGTRGSKLALYQANHVKSELEKKLPNYKYEIIIIKTQGDKILDVPLAKIGDKGLFTKELENALFDKRIDFAVHSLKDLPTVYPKGAKLGAILKRADNRDALVSNSGKTLQNLNTNDVIATSSLRRKAQLLAINKDFNIVDIRGNVNSRIKKMEDGYCTVMLMAAAGIKRLELNNYISELVDHSTIIPACGQGAIAIEIRENDTLTQEIVSHINHHETFVATTAERTFLHELEGGCQIPIGSFAEIVDENLYLTGYLSDLDGKAPLIFKEKGSINKPALIGKKLAKKIIENGGDKIIESFRVFNEMNLNPKPLKGIKIVSTKPQKNNDYLKEDIERAGGKFIAFPTIEISSNKIDNKDVDELKNIHKYDWIIFTSKNGVHFFFEHLNSINNSTLLSNKTKIAVIGEATKNEVELFSYHADFVSSGNTSKELLDQLIINFDLKNNNILLPLGNLANDYIEKELKSIATVYRVNVYNNLLPENIDNEKIEILLRANYDLIIFTSPSCFYNLLKLVPDLNIKSIKAACIGSVTANALKEKGIPPIIISDKSNTKGLIQSIVSYYDTNELKN